MLIAINRHLVNKASKDDIAKANSKFESIDLDATSLAAEIKKGHAFCAQHRPGSRKSSGFIRAGFLAVDIDHGLTLDAARSDPYFRQFASILYTTPSHTDEKHRFRIVFELETPIGDERDMAQALTGLAARFGGDGACTDACRMFFGSSASTPETYAHRLPASEVAHLIIRGGERRTLSDSVGEEGSRRSAVRSRIDLPANIEVRLENGGSALLREVPARTRIFCPCHVDTRPSAFTLRNQRGNPGLYCSACAATYFVQDGSDRAQQHRYIFDYQWQRILNVTVEEYEAYADDNGHVDIGELRGGRIRVLDRRHLAFDEIIPVVSPAMPKLKFNAHGDVIRSSDPMGHFDVASRPEPGLVVDKPLTLIRSPKGTGKTEWLGKLVSMFKGHDVTVLLIGHRRALISATANRIGLTSYLGEFGEESAGPRIGAMPTEHYAICVDSLPRMAPSVDKYDVVLIDEVEQVFAHLLSDTLKEDRREALHTLRHYLQNAKAIYALDADLSSVTIELLDAVFQADSPTYQAIVNQWQPVDRSVDIYEGSKPDQLVGELTASIQRGERCFVCSNSKKLVEELSGGIAKRVARPLKMLVITSDNSQHADIQAIIRNIKVRALDYDVIFTSPALGTGIDITFDDDAQCIDTVFGFFRARINTHFDIDQQLSRVRNPKRICVWISAEEFRFETDAEAIKAELLGSEAQHQRFLRLERDGTKVYDRDEFYETVFSVVTAAQRASKNRLRQNFMELRRANGWKVNVVGTDADLSSEGRAIAARGKAERRSADFERILHARKITTDEYDDLRRDADRERLKEADVPAMRRYEIESFYLEDVTPELLEEDGERRLRSAIAWHEILMASDEDLVRHDRYAESNLTPDKPFFLLKKKLLEGLLQRAHLIEDGSIARNAFVDASRLAEFSTHCIEQKTQIERLFDIGVRTNVRKDPITQLKSILKLIGLGLVKVGRDQSGGTSKVQYRLNSMALDQLVKWTALRSIPEHRDDWRRKRSRSETNADLNEIDSEVPLTSTDPLDEVR